MTDEEAGRRIDRAAVRRGYEDHAEAYAERTADDGRVLDVLDEFLAGRSPDRVLDAGCGHGVPVLRRLDASATAVGLDFSRAQLGIAGGNVPAALLVEGDVTALPFREDAFDVVTAVDSVIHVPLDDHQRVFEEFARVLRPGGRLLLSEAPTERRRTNPDWLGEGVEMQWAMAGEEATREALESAGFEVTRKWSPPETEPDEPPEPPFFAARHV